MDQKILEDVEIFARKIEGEQIWLELRIREQSRLFKVVFEGIRKGEKESLNDKIKLPKGRIISNTMIKNTQLAVKRYFIDKGFLNTKVQMVQIADTARGNATLKVVVSKGVKVKIRQITFNGRKELLEGKFSCNEQPLLAPRTRVKPDNVLEPSPEGTVTKPDNLILVNPAVVYHPLKKKYYLYYNHNHADNCIIIGATVGFQQATLYFKSEKVLEELIERFGEDDVKKYYFGIEE